MRVLPRCERSGIGTAILLVGRREVQQRQEAADLVVDVAHDEEARRLPVEPALGDRGRRLALGLAHQLQDALAVAVAGRLGIVMAPRVPVDRRQDARQVAEEELEIECRALLCSPARRLQAGVDVTADATEEALVALGVAPAQIGVERVAGEVVREHAVRARIDEGKVAQPCEHVMGIVEGDGVPDQRFGGHARKSARLEGATALIGRDQIDESSQQRGDEVGRQRVDLGLPATRRDVGEQGQPERVAVAHLGETLVRGWVDAARAQVAPALLRTQVAERHHSEEAAPRGVAPPARGRQVAARDDRESVSGQRRQQRRADPAVQIAQAVVSVDHQDEPRAGRRRRPVQGRRTERGAKNLVHLAGRRRQLAAVEPHDARAAQLSACSARTSRRLVFPIPPRAREPQHREQRLGGFESGTEELTLGLASDEAPATA